MDNGIDRGRRTRRPFVLGISLALLVTLWIYSLSLDHWGATRAVIFTVSGFALIAVGLWRWDVWTPISSGRTGPS